MINQHPFLSSEECKSIRDEVHSLKEHWENREKNMLPFFTLGTPCYMQEPPKVYAEKVSKRNPVLEKRFETLYTKLAQKVESLFKIPVSYPSEFSLPGFHICLADNELTRPLFFPHYDVQYKYLKWNYQEVDFTRPFTFTASIALPQEGSYLAYWDVKREETEHMNQDEFVNYVQTKEKKKFHYILGGLVIHEGLILHQIPNATNVVSDDERITLQGHGLICDGKLLLYW